MKNQRSKNDLKKKLAHSASYGSGRAGAPFHNEKGSPMLPLELYWPPELLAEVLPNQFGHLLKVKQATPSRTRPATSRYTAEQRGGCTILWLSAMALGRRASWQ